jgi:hypothetical protein
MYILFSSVTTGKHPNGKEVHSEVRNITTVAKAKHKI